MTAEAECGEEIRPALHRGRKAGISVKKTPYTSQKSALKAADAIPPFFTSRLD